MAAFRHHHLARLDVNASLAGNKPLYLGVIPLTPKSSHLKPEKNGAQPTSLDCWHLVTLGKEMKTDPLALPAREVTQFVGINLIGSLRSTIFA